MLYSKLGMIIRDHSIGISEKYEERMTSIKEEYKASKVLPRKAKKKLRKKLQEEYSFLVTLQELSKSLF